LSGVTPQTVYLSLGSNIGNREANLRTAIVALPAAGIELIQVSSIYETEPVDYLDQAWFLNGVVEARTELEPFALLRALRKIETQMGSKKEFTKGPRLIDLDILLYGNEAIATQDLQIPHPRMHLRRFVLVPLAEIAPDLRHPSWSGAVTDLLASVKDRGQVRCVSQSLFFNQL
jgi:2-amino-4-hydroxy-6-hydroxymethyldihydropteridine diphosphokinase